MYIITYKTKDNKTAIERDINSEKRLRIRMNYLIKKKSLDHIISWEYKHTINKLNLTDLESSYESIGYENIFSYYENNSTLKDKFKVCSDKIIKID
jgi:hypothetical protein